MSQYLPDLIKHLSKTRFNKAIPQVATTNMTIINENTGESGDVLVKFRKDYIIDNETFTKYFKNEIKLSNSKLSITACYLIFYIMENLKQNDNTIELNKNYLLKYFNLKSLNSIYSAIRELINLNILKKTNTKNLYEVNPMIFFNGNRFNFIKKKVTITPNGVKITEYVEMQK